MKYAKYECCDTCGRAHLTAKSCQEALEGDLRLLLHASPNPVRTLRRAVEAAQADVESEMTPREVARRLEQRRRE